ncbi:MAG: FecR domain-containing protein, partial [Bdellovibrionales bacterium]|nr:FecR domain-containing protein [Bdellovibrionales bacterium]
MVNFNKTDKAILLVSTLIILFYSYLLYDDSFLFPHQESSYQTVGILSKSANDVRLKSIESYLWTPARSSEKLHEKDSIFTGDNSGAEVVLNDGSTINLESNSLIILSMKENGLELNLKYGEIQTRLKKLAKLEIKSDRQNLIFKNNKDSDSQIKIKKTNLSPAKVKLID